MPEGLWADPERGVAGWGGGILDLSSQEVSMLAALIESRDRVATRADLLRERGWQGRSLDAATPSSPVSVECWATRR